VLRLAGDVAEGALGISAVLVVDNASGAHLLDRRGTLELADANFYDAAAAVFLAIVQAADQLEDPTQVTRAQIRDSLKRVSEKQGATVVSAGPEGLLEGIHAIKAGLPIDYDGASGPIDFSARTTDPAEDDDAGGNVRNDLEEFFVMGGQFVPGDLFDCIAQDCARVER
jgi:hypothetical protein